MVHDMTKWSTSALFKLLLVRIDLIAQHFVLVEILCLRFLILLVL